MALFGRSLFILGQDGINDGVKGTEDRSVGWLGSCVRSGLGVLEDVADLTSGVMKGAGDLVNAHAVAMCAANLAIVVHRQHPYLRSPKAPGWGASSRTDAAGVGPFYSPLLSLWW